MLQKRVFLLGMMGFWSAFRLVPRDAISDWDHSDTEHILEIVVGQ